MARVDKYIKKNGETAYKFRIFLGLDYNGKQKYIKKSGFSTKKQALEKLAEIEGKLNLNKNIFNYHFKICIKNG
ncbi:Arm DNA-binding domain-containing protein [Enterococcus faecium]|nr:Arm DNA-binding domain-containing protein [Enterococcus faecium]